MISQCRWHWRIFAESVIHVHAFHKSAFLHVTLLSFLFNYCELMCRFLKLQTTKNRFKEISKFYLHNFCLSSFLLSWNKTHGQDTAFMCQYLSLQHSDRKIFCWFWQIVSLWGLQCVLWFHARSALYESCGLIAKPAAEKMFDRNDGLYLQNLRSFNMFTLVLFVSQSVLCVVACFQHQFFVFRIWQFSWI